MLSPVNLQNQKPNAGLSFTQHGDYQISLVLSNTNCSPIHTLIQLLFNGWFSMFQTNNYSIHQ